MISPQHDLVRQYLCAWSDEDWSEVDDLLGAMSLPEALVEVHRRKLAEQRLIEPPPIAAASQIAFEQASLDLS